MKYFKGQLKLKIEETLAKPDGAVLFDDLNNLVPLTKTDSDLDLTIKAIKRYVKFDK